MSTTTGRISIALATFVLGVCAAAIWYLKLPSRNPPVVKSDRPAPHTPKQTRSEEIKKEIEEDAGICLWQDRIPQVVPAIYDEYAADGKKTPTGKLVELDAKLRAFFDSRPRYYPCGNEMKFSKKEYAEMGVGIDYGELLSYDGKLLEDAHRRDPRSPYREYTLFSEVTGRTESLGYMPNIKGAYAYEKEFPEGPFVAETQSIIAEFNKDLYMVLRDDLDDYKYDCFKPYIDRTPRTAQAESARQKSEAYFEKLLRRNPNDAELKWDLDSIKNGKVKSWSFCAD